jgi:hypothetical protein
MSDVNKLKDILSRSKAIMQKTEQNYGTTSNETQSFGISEGEEKEIPNLTEDYISKNYNGNTKSVAPTNGRYRNLEKSKMPNFIKEAMINNPIEIPETPYHTFELDDVVDLMDKNEYKEQPKTVNRTQKTNNVSVDEKTIRNIVKEEMESVVRSVIEEYLDKSLVTEDIQIRVGGTTFSGKLKPLIKIVGVWVISALSHH